MLADKTEYLTAGIHIGMKTCTPYMKQFVYKVREDGLAVFNLKLTDERLKIGADFLSRFKDILVVSRKENAFKAVETFGNAVSTRFIKGRFSPGTLTNPSYREFCEPEVLFVADPLVDEQAIKEAKKKMIPIVALCDTFNEARDVDYIIPVNNNGRKSLALIFYVLAREILKSKGKIKNDSEFKFKVDDFDGGDKREQAPVREEEEGKKGRRRQKKDEL